LIESFYALRLNDQNAMNNIDFRWVKKKEFIRNAKTFSFCEDLRVVILLH